MGEQDSAKSYLVDIKAIKINWILMNNNNHGHDFFSALLKTENLEIYENAYLKVIIEWMY